MVVKLVKVTSIISIYLLCNCIFSVNTGSILQVNNQLPKPLSVTTLSAIGDEMKKGIDPIEPSIPTVNPTNEPITSSTSTTTTTTTSSTTKPSTTTNSSTISTTVTSAPSSTASSTVAPPSPVTTPTTPSTTGGNDRHFDGASFIGGIVLAAGLACIGFVGFKVYRARTERNYHTL